MPEQYQTFNAALNPSRQIKSDFDIDREIWQSLTQTGYSQPGYSHLNEQKLLQIQNQNKQQKIAAFEREAGLNEGDIAKATLKLRQDIDNEARIIDEQNRQQRSQALSDATNKSLHPSLRLKIAQKSGVPIASGEDLDGASEPMKRMSKVLADKNLSPDLKQQSIDRELEDIKDQTKSFQVGHSPQWMQSKIGVYDGPTYEENQERSRRIDQSGLGLTYRTAEQGGRRGMAITGRRSLDEEPRYEFAPEGGTREPLLQEAKILGETPGYVPTPRELTPEQITEQFIQTLESGGTPAEQARNAVRISEFQARRPKPVTLSPGQQLFETTPGGEARAVARVPFKPSILKAPKPPTKASVEGTVLQKVMQGAQLTPGEQKIYAGTFKKGFSVTLPNGTIIQQGGSAEDKFLKTRGAETQLEKDALQAITGLADLTDLTTFAEQLDPEVFTYLGAGGAWLARLGEKASLGDYVPKSLVKLMNQVKDFKARSGQSFTIWRKWATGVQASDKELEILQEFRPSPDDSREEFLAKAEGAIEVQTKSLARLIKLGLLNNVKTAADGTTSMSASDRRKLRVLPLDSMGIEQAREILREAQLLSRPSGQPAQVVPIGNNPIPRDVAAKLFRTVGGDRQKAEALARDLGYTF